MSQTCLLLGPFRSHFTICLFPCAPMETWIGWHLMKICESIDAHRREKNMQKRTWRKKWHWGKPFIHALSTSDMWGLAHYCRACWERMFVPLKLLWVRGVDTHTAPSSATARLQCLRHGVGVATRLRAGRSVVRIPAAEMNFFLFPKVQTGSRALRDFANAPKKWWRPRPFYKCSIL